MGGAHEQMEQAEQVEHVGGRNKRIALLIAVLALCLAFSETLGKNAQTGSISYNVEASNLWAFFQAKTIRHDGGAHRGGSAVGPSLHRGRSGRQSGDDEADRKLAKNRQSL